MNILKRVIFALVIAVIVILMLFPFLWMLMSAFKTQVDIIAWPPRFVFTPTLRNFERVFVEQYQSLSYWDFLRHTPLPGSIRRRYRCSYLSPGLCQVSLS